MTQDYNSTLNLPKTDFPMRAGLPEREPETLAAWDGEKVYERLMRINEGKPLFVLHDGPPYANGDIHMGTAFNKVLKDFIVRYKNMSGFKSPYVPGWDTHGLPIELKARKQAGESRATQLTPLELRQLCKEFALSFVDGQREQFKRLGVTGEWDDPYLTLRPAFEAKQIELFGAMAEKGYIYRGLKPVYWCPQCQTALAEAEIEYAEDPCHSIYVKFQVKDDKGLFSALGIDPSNVYFVIWTTTTWTLPGNVAICLGPEYEYDLIKAGGEYYVMAKALAPAALEAAHVHETGVVGTFKGAELENIVTAHPFLDRDSLVIVGDHVTLESGTGCVHTAPGHGVEDFEATRSYGLPVVVPVDNKGVLTAEAGEFAGLTTEQANRAIGKKLETTGHLLALEKIIHQYPHCWRCKDPVLFRATEQWFCSVEAFKEQAVSAVRGVKWYPAWGEERIISMVRERSDWCISRQRLWGVPIPIFFCEKCGKALIDIEVIRHVASIFKTEGSDAWYARSARELMPEGVKCPACGHDGFRKETDIMDVWFDSGVSHAAVCEERPYLHSPADVYLEGGDQHRGWFQSSLLTSVATRGRAPYRAVVTHGMVVDGEGKKMSKSLGNGIDPSEITGRYGADILRLWVASADYQVDVRLSQDILKQLSEVYRKIRNTARFILGCIGDFDPDENSVPDSAFADIDRWALQKLDRLLAKVRAAYEEYEFHVAFHAIHNFCVTDMSNFYLDILKDRLYVEAPNSETRRAAQTVIYRVLDALTLMTAPILAFTADEIWRAMPHEKAKNPERAVFNEIPKLRNIYDEAFMARFERLRAVREDAQKALEVARAAKVIGASLEACVEFFADGETLEFLRGAQADLPGLLIVSEVKVHGGASAGEYKSEQGFSLTVGRASGEKCARCWIYTPAAERSAGHGHICARCAGVLESLK